MYVCICMYVYVCICMHVGEYRAQIELNVMSCDSQVTLSAVVKITVGHRSIPSILVE